MKKSIKIWIMLLFTMTGCKNIYLSSQRSPYYINPNKRFSDIARVAVIEFRNKSDYPGISEDITKAVYQQLQKEQFFGLTMIHKDNPLWTNLQLGAETPLTLEQLSYMYKQLNCDGILIGTVTDYKPYPHMTLGIHLTLIDLRDGEILWAIEDIWDASEKTTQENIQKYYENKMYSESKSLNKELTEVSPIRFIKFVAYEIALPIGKNYK